MNRRIILSIFFFVISIYGCVSVKKYKELENKYNSLDKSNRYYSKLNDHLDSINTATVNENSLLYKKNEELTITVKNMSNHIEAPTESIMPLIPNPPPASTDYLEFKHIFRKSKTYLQADKILNDAFEKSDSKKIYLAFQGTGFAVCTPIDEIDYKGNKVKEVIASPESISAFVSNIFSKKHLDELMFSRKGYYRWVVFIVASDINEINGNEMDPEIIKNWVNHYQTKFPFEKLKNPMPSQTMLYALLYEFEQNENLRGKLTLLRGTYITNLKEFNIIKTLKKMDYEKH